MKKIISVILALVMCAVFLPGCAPGDVELYNALERSEAAENYTAVTTLSYKLDVSRPFASVIDPQNELYSPYWDYEAEAAEYNEQLANFAELGDRLKVKAVTAKAGDNSKIDVTLAMPDAEADFTLWQQGENRIIAHIPSMVSPFIYELAGGKPYIYADAAEVAAMLTDGEAVPKVSAELTEQIKNAFVGRLTYPLVTEAAQKGDETVYTVRLDAAAVKGLSIDALSVLSEPEVVSLLAAAVYAIDSEDSVTSDELKESLAEGLEESKISAEDFFAAIEASGLLKNGLTLHFTVKDSLVTRREAEFKIDIDAEKLFAAFNGYGGVREFDGAFSVSVSAVTDFTYGSAAVQMPVLTAENSIDIGAEYAEYKAYEAAHEAWFESMIVEWSNRHYPSDYLLERSADTPITIKNLENGKEVTVTPGIVVAGGGVWQYGIAVPVEEAISIIDGASMSWNSTTMGVEVRHPYISSYYDYEGVEAVLFLPNADGVAYVREYLENSDYGYYTREYYGDVLSSETVYLLQSYDNIFYEDYGYADDGSVLGYSPYYDENGKVYADFDELFKNMGYTCKLEGNVLSLHRVDASFSYDGIEDNFFYKLYGGNDIYYDYDDRYGYYYW